VTQFYTAPTAIRALMRFGPEVTSQYDLSSLRILGTVGEPINPEVTIFIHCNLFCKCGHTDDSSAFC
jgi:acetyl-CoA synthetase